MKKALLTSLLIITAILSCNETEVKFQALPIRKVQTISVKINQSIDEILTIDLDPKETV